MAKRRRSSRRRKHTAVAGSHHRRSSNPFVRHHRRARNPLPLSTHDIPATIGGVIVGGVAASVIPTYLPAPFNGGIWKVAASLAVAVGGALGLQKYRNLSLGWFIAGVTVAAGQALDELTGKQFVSFQNPLGMGSYYKSGYVPLPTTTEQSPFLLPAAPVAVVRAGSPNAASKKGMGWNPRFSSRFAA